MQKSEAQIMHAWKDMDVPLLSVACITYNHEKYIEDAIRGFLIQETNFPFEVIIHDDASTDNAPNIIKKYAEKYPNIIKPVLQVENQFTKPGKNVQLIAMSHASGKYIALCDGDDYWIDPRKLQKQVDFLEENSGFSMCAHEVNIQDDIQFAKTYTFSCNKSEMSTKDIIVERHQVLTGSLVFRNILKHFPSFFYQTISGDICLILLLSLEGDCYIFHEVMGCYRHHSGGITKRKLKAIEIYKSNYVLYKEFDKYSNFIYHRFIIKKLARVDLFAALMFFKEKEYKQGLSCFFKAHHKDFFVSIRTMIKILYKGIG